MAHASQFYGRHRLKRSVGTSKFIMSLLHHPIWQVFMMPQWRITDEGSLPRNVRMIRPFKFHQVRKWCIHLCGSLYLYRPQWMEFVLWHCDKTCNFLQNRYRLHLWHAYSTGEAFSNETKVDDIVTLDFYLYNSWFGLRFHLENQKFHKHFFFRSCICLGTYIITSAPSSSSSSLM